jgi:hypothetical protein
MTDKDGPWYLCFVLRRRGRVRHWHWPKRDIVHCENSKADQEEVSE